MHKRMLQVSARLAAQPPRPGDAALREKLHRAQANDAYWHGLFGGLYLPHLRRAVWNNLLSLEADLDALAPRAPGERGDIDLDGNVEIFLRNRQAQAVARADGDACVVEFSSYALAHNFGDTLRRQAESYHDTLRRQRGEAGAHPANGAGGGIASAHDRVHSSREIDPQDLEPDSRPCALFVESWIAAGGETQPLDRYRATGETAFRVQLAATDATGVIDKVYALDGACLCARYRAEGALPPGGRLAIRIHLAMPSCDGFLGRYVLADGAIAGGFGQKLELDATRSLTLEDRVLGGALRLELSLPLVIAAQPRHTVSQSEAGYEKIMQAVELLLLWTPTAGAELTASLTIVPFAAASADNH